MDSYLDTMLTVKETASLLKLTPITIYEYIRNSKLPSVRFGRYYRIIRRDLLRFIESHKYQG